MTYKQASITCSQCLKVEQSTLITHLSKIQLRPRSAFDSRLIEPPQPYCGQPSEGTLQPEALNDLQIWAGVDGDSFQAVQPRKRVLWQKRERVCPYAKFFEAVASGKRVRIKR